MVNWEQVLSVTGRETLRYFVSGNLSGRELTSLVSFTPAAGEVRKLLRKRGVSQARQLVRKALARR